VNVASSKIDNTTGRVQGIYQGENSVITQLNTEQLPTPEQRPGKVAELHINYETGVLFYEYVDAPMTETERLLNDRLALAEAQNAALAQSIAELTILIATPQNQLKENE